MQGSSPGVSPTILTRSVIGFTVNVVSSPASTGMPKGTKAGALVERQILLIAVRHSHCVGYKIKSRGAGRI